MSAILLLSLLVGVLPLVSSQGDNYVLSYDRIQPFNGPVGNIILMQCRNAIDGDLVQDPDFFRNGLLFDLPQKQVMENQGVRFIVDRSSEGNYSCGRETGFGVDSSAPPMTIIARPVHTVIPSIEPSFENDSSTAELKCSITPGSLTQLYYVRWRNASDPNMILFQSFPRLRSGQTTPFNRDEDRYFIDPLTFSLFIRDVGPSDEGNYQCVLGLVDSTDNFMDNFSPYTYESTRDANISLSVYRSPQFVQQPTSLVVLNGTNVTFTCAVVSSPLASEIGWKLGDKILSNGDRVTIEPRTEEDANGQRTISPLTLFNVSGFDSNKVECFTVYRVDAAIMFPGVTSTTELSVLDGVTLLPPIPFQSDGFVYTIALKNRLLIPVGVDLLYIDEETGRDTLIPSTANSEVYFNTSTIHYIAFSDRVPSYKKFYLGIRLVYGGLQGPYSPTDNVYGQPGLSAFDITFWIILGVLIVLILMIAVVIIILMCLCYYCLRNKNQVTLGAIMKGSYSLFKEEMKNKFTAGKKTTIVFSKSVADQYAKAVLGAIEYGRKHEIVKDAFIEFDEHKVFSADNLQHRHDSAPADCNGGAPTCHSTP